MQFDKDSSPPKFNKKYYPRAKIYRTWFGESGYLGKTAGVFDIEGNFNLMCASPRAIRLLINLKSQKPIRG